MAKVRDIKRHINSVGKIQQITKAMYAISMTRVSKSKQQLLQARQYSQAQSALVGDLIGSVTEDHPWRKGAEGLGYLFVINADRGLCGRFKGDLNREAEHLLKQNAASKLVLGGDKADVYFRSSSYTIEDRYINLYDKPTFQHAQQVGNDLIARYNEDRLPLDVVYMRYLNDFRQEVAVERLLPLGPPQTSEEADSGSAALEYVYEPSQAHIFEAVIPQYVRSQIYRMLLESKTSEHAIRRQSMKNATDNADELIDDLTLEFNKARQQEITKQLLDIMGGAEALRTA